MTHRSEPTHYIGSMHRRAAFALAAVLVLVTWAVAQQLEDTFYIPLDDPAIQYGQRPVNDPVARLQQRLESGKGKAGSRFQRLGISSFGAQAARHQSRFPGAGVFQNQHAGGKHRAPNAARHLLQRRCCRRIRAEQRRFGTRVARSEAGRPVLCAGERRAAQLSPRATAAFAAIRGPRRWASRDCSSARSIRSRKAGRNMATPS